jgi:hypothetical protein
MKTFIFDLDHTVIDSSHRQITLADGSLDLNNWIENCTKEKIMADKLLPLADLMRDRIFDSQANDYFEELACEVVVCTARVMGEHDHAFLAAHGLKPHAVLSRPLGDRSGDADLKERLLRQYASDTGKSWARFSRNACIYDDNKNVLSRLASIGIACYNAISLNKTMAA